MIFHKNGIVLSSQFPDYSYGDINVHLRIVELFRRGFLEIPFICSTGEDSLDWRFLFDFTTIVSSTLSSESMEN